jgi:hypothetical protein
MHYSVVKAAGHTRVEDGALVNRQRASSEHNKYY